MKVNNVAKDGYMQAKDFLSQQGLDVELTSEKLGNDPWAKTMLKEIGKILTKREQAKGMKYLGSFAFHIVADQNMGIDGKLDMGSITQINIDEECSERLATLAFNNGVLELRRYFNPNVKTGRRGDRR